MTDKTKQNPAPKPRVLSIVNQKGGVGKTTTTVNLATALAAVGKRVLVIDFDPQGNASTGLGIEQASREYTSYDIVLNDVSTTTGPLQMGSLKFDSYRFANKEFLLNSIDFLVGNNGIFETLFGQDVIGPQIFPHHFHDPAAAARGHARMFRMGGRDG